MKHGIPPKPKGIGYPAYDYMKIWQYDDKDKKAMKMAKEISNDETNIEVDLGGTKLLLCGYNQAFNDNARKQLFFAWKFKQEKRLILYYIPDYLVNTRLASKIISFIKQQGAHLGYKVQDTRELFASNKVQDTRELFASIKAEGELLAKNTVKK